MPTNTLRKRKLELIDAITDLIDSFEQETGAHVIYIGLEPEASRREDDRNRWHRVFVETDDDEKSGNIHGETKGNAK
jgi:hypothetical protein